MSAYSSAPGEVAGTGRGVRGGPPSPLSGTGGRPWTKLAADAGAGDGRVALRGPVVGVPLFGGEIGDGVCLFGEGLGLRPSLATGGGGASDELELCSPNPCGAGGASGGRKDAVAVS